MKSAKILWFISVEGAKREGACSYTIPFTGTEQGVAQQVRRIKARESKMGYRPKVIVKPNAHQ